MIMDGMFLLPLMAYCVHLEKGCLGLLSWPRPCSYCLKGHAYPLNDFCSGCFCIGWLFCCMFFLCVLKSKYAL